MSVDTHEYLICKFCDLKIEDREQRCPALDELCDALDENTKSKAIDRAPELTIALLGAVQFDQGKIDEPLETADAEGSLTTRDIATVLDTDPVPIEYENRWSIGE